MLSFHRHERILTSCLAPFNAPGHVFSRINADAIILYLCDDGKGNLMHEAWKVGDVLDMIEGKRK